MIFTNIFDAKIIDYKAECNCTGDVFPKDFCVGCFIVVFLGEILPEVLVHEAACLR